VTRPRTLTWRQVDDVLGVPGWSLTVGFTSTREPGDAPDVWIHCAEINTGHSLIPLFRADLPNVTALEAIVAEAIEGEDRQSALELSHRDPRDDGDYSFDIENERRHERKYADHIGAMVHALEALR